MKILFWSSLILIVYTYLIYPVLIYILSQFYKKPIRGKYLFPKVSVIISAYNEEANIENKIKTLLCLEYPENNIEFLIASDGSTDKTDEIIKRFKKIKFFRQEPRQGKPSMLNFLTSKASGEILVFTDARQRLDSKSIQEIVKYFVDSKVGSVSGELHYEWEEGNKTASGLGLYWRYEKFIRKSESRMGSMLGATGALYAIRRELFPELPENLILDDVYIPMKIVEKGFRAVFDKRAKVYDKIFVDTRAEFLRKTRTLAGNYQLFFYLRGLFNPFKGKIAWQFFSHKFLRLIVPFLLVILFISSLNMPSKIGTVPAGNCPYFYQVFLLLQIIFYIFAALGVIFKKENRLFDIPNMFCVMNIAAVVGLYQILFNKTGSKWQKANY